MKNYLISIFIAPIFFLATNISKSQSIDDLITLLDTTQGVNLGEHRKLEIYQNLKSNPDSVIVLYGILERRFQRNKIVNELIIKSTDTPNFYEINGYGVDFDPEYLSIHADNYALIYSATFCKPCKVLAEDMKSYLSENNIQDFKIYYFTEDLDNEGQIQEMKKVHGTRARMAYHLRGRPDSYPCTYFINKGQITDVILGSGPPAIEVLKESTQTEK